MKLIDANTPIQDSVLNLIAHLPTKSLSAVICPDFFTRLTDNHFMRIATLLAQKSYLEGGCPIGAVIINDRTRNIIGKGHNTLVQENHPYNHGETAAIRDAGRYPFHHTTLFTSLSPCDVCASLLYMRQFKRVVVGDITNACGNEHVLREKGVAVDVLEDPLAINLYAKYRREKPELDQEDWKGISTIEDVAQA